MTTTSSTSSAPAVQYPFVTQPSFLGAHWAPLTELTTATTTRYPYALIGIPYDGSTTNRAGARFGPHAIRKASHMLCEAMHPYFAQSPVTHLVDFGDISFPQTQHDQAMVSISRALSPLLLSHHVCTLGGDHAITLPLLRLQAKQHQQPLALVHFDAHCDTWPDHFGEPSGHGTWVYEALQEGIIDAQKTVQIGLRSSGEAHIVNTIRHCGGIIQTAKELRGLDGITLQPHIDAIMQRIGDAPTYLTVDIDCLDPAFAPGTGTPEPAGLSSSQLFTYLEHLNLNFIGMDCVEVSPPYDHAEITALAAAHVVWTYLCARLAF